MSVLSSQHHSWTPFLVLLFVQVVSTETLVLLQTIPQNGLVCPGDQLQYICMSTMSELSWTIGTSNPVIFNGNMEINSNISIGDFVLLLSAKNATSITSIATNDMVTSTYDGQQIACYSGNLLEMDIIAVADGPASCSNMSVVPYCSATINFMGDTIFFIGLSTVNNLMCVEGYQVQFGGESENVSLNSDSAKFTISYGLSVENEIVLYTLDYEDRKGPMPCIFTIPALDAVENFLQPQCTMITSENVDVAFFWVTAVVGGCLVANAQFVYIVEFNDSRFDTVTTLCTCFFLKNTTRETVVEITISPSLPFIGLTGPPLSETFNLADINCSTSSATPTTSNSAPTGSNIYVAPGDNSLSFAVIMAVVVLASLGLVVTLLVIVVGITIIMCSITPRVRRPVQNQISMMPLRSEQEDDSKTQAMKHSPECENQAQEMRERKLEPGGEVSQSQQQVQNPDDPVQKSEDGVQASKFDNQVLEAEVPIQEGTASLYANLPQNGNGVDAAPQYETVCQSEATSQSWPAATSQRWPAATSPKQPSETSQNDKRKSLTSL